MDDCNSFFCSHSCDTYLNHENLLHPIWLLIRVKTELALTKILRGFSKLVTFSTIGVYLQILCIALFCD